MHSGKRVNFQIETGELKAERGNPKTQNSNWGYWGYNRANNKDINGRRKLGRGSEMEDSWDIELYTGGGEPGIMFIQARHRGRLNQGTGEDFEFL